MSIRNYIDATYLKTAKQASLSESENEKVVVQNIQEAIDENFKLIMIRPENVSLANKMISKSNSKVTIGTVISFPEGTNTLAEKLSEAQIAINDGADDLDFVINYKAFKKGEINLVKTEVLECSKLALENNKIVKWIIEVAALTDAEIIRICVLIKNVIIANFKEEFYSDVFIKSSTGFFETQDNLPNGATFSSIIMMLENGSPLSIKASGGIKTFEDAAKMIKLGVSRIGTSNAKAIANQTESNSDY